MDSIATPLDTGTETLAKSIFIKDLKSKDHVKTTFLVRSKELMNAKNGKPYLTLTLTDRTGAIDTRVWENVDALSELFGEGDVVAVAGKTHFFQNRLQLVVEHLTALPSDEVDITHYLPKASENLDTLFGELTALFEGLSNKWIKEISLALLNDPEIAHRYKLCPAAKTIHHAFIGGLLCHSRNLTRVADSVLPHYPDLNRDLVMFGCAFHDFGKIFELSFEGNFGYTDEGKLVGHIPIGAILIDRKARLIPGFPKETEWQLKHLVLSHHGRLEYGSPKRPATLEAQFVHHLDDMDSKLDSISTFMKSERNGSRWSGYHKAYDQYYYKPDAYLIEGAHD